MNEYNKDNDGNYDYRYTIWNLCWINLRILSILLSAVALVLAEPEPFLFSKRGGRGESHQFSIDRVEIIIMSKLIILSILLSAVALVLAEPEPFLFSKRGGRGGGHGGRGGRGGRGGHGSRGGYGKREAE
eukprot:maker-scaffold602_size127160-snap-gene-0.26 protein:Tk12437 transcript:maker-scaffold602_size127160-snap-gene-0.26-mRNA-1 annotation:"dna rna helicase"